MRSSCRTQSLAAGRLQAHAGAAHLDADTGGRGEDPAQTEAADGGGLTAAERVCRERVRLEAAEMIEAGATDQEGGAAVPGTADVANRWSRALAAGGRDALGTKGADGAKCRISPAQLAELGAGSAAWGGTACCPWAEVLAAPARARVATRVCIRLVHRIRRGGQGRR